MDFFSRDGLLATLGRVGLGHAQGMEHGEMPRSGHVMMAILPKFGPMYSPPCTSPWIQVVPTRAAFPLLPPLSPGFLPLPSPLPSCSPASTMPAPWPPLLLCQRSRREGRGREAVEQKH